MVRFVTFGLLSAFVALNAIKFGLLTSDNWGFHIFGDWILVFVTALILGGSTAVFRLCEQGKFADYLTEIDEETSQIDWPNRPKIVHAASVVVSVIAILAIGLCFHRHIDSISISICSAQGNYYSAHTYFSWVLATVTVYVIPNPITNTT